MSHTIPAVCDFGEFHPLTVLDLAKGIPAEVIPLAAGGLTSWQACNCEQMAGVLVGEDFDGPPQGKLPDPKA